MTLTEVIDNTGRYIDAAGVAVILVGAIIASVSYVATMAGRGATLDAYRDYRHRLGRSILLGLELLVAADIIRTVAVTPTLESVGVLAGIVLIRTFLSLSLEVEIEGRWPWQRRPD